MKILFLNVWHGQQLGFYEYVADLMKTVDIFCFQEAYPEVREKLLNLLPDWQVFHVDKIVTDDEFSSATYVRKNLKVNRCDYVLKDELEVGLGIFTEVEGVGGSKLIGNFHGLAYPGTKLDTPERLRQSKLLIEYLSTKKTPIVLGGDFNLEYNSESVAMFEKANYDNLIKKYNIKTTRNKVSWSMYPDSPQLYSDYVFTKEIKEKSFSVPEIVVSDHQAMMIEI